MTRLSINLLSTVFLVILASSAAATQRVVVAEMFTNVY